MALSPFYLGCFAKPYFKGKAPFFLHFYNFTQDIIHYLKKIMFFKKS